MTLAIRYTHARIPERIVVETAKLTPNRLRHLLIDVSFADFAVDNELRQIRQRMRHHRPDFRLRLLSAIHRISMKRVILSRLRPAWAHPGHERMKLLRDTLLPPSPELLAWYPNWMQRRGATVARLIHLSVLLLFPLFWALSGLCDHRQLGVMLRDRIFRRP